MFSYSFSTLTEYIELVDSLSGVFKTNSNDLWFRGIKDEKLELVPGVIWRGITEEREETIVAEFEIYYKNYTQKKPKNSLELYTLMQHYGLPTRFLDWSMSPLISLYFALEEADYDSATRVVWVINPQSLNEISIDYKAIIVPSTHKISMINKYLPKYLRRSIEKIPDSPVAINVPLNNQRITAQKGAFTLHGFSGKTINEVFSENNIKSIAKLSIKSEEYRLPILRQLHNIGIKEDDVYQDLNSLCTRIIREYSL